MNTFGGNRKPQRSSLRLTVDPVDSASEGTGSLKSLNRRVSFSQYVFVLGEDDNGSQMCVSNRFTSDVSMEDDFHDGADNDEKEAGDVTLINDVSMEVAPYACVDIKHMSFNEDQTINMEMGDEGSQYDHADNVISSSKYNSLQSVCVSTDQTVVADSSVSDKTLQQDDSDMEVQITLCQLPTGSKSVNMSVTSGIELNHLPIDEKTDNNSNNKNLCRKQDIRDDSYATPRKKEHGDVKIGKVNAPYKSPHLLPHVMLSSLSSRRMPTSVIKMPLVNLNPTGSVRLSKRQCYAYSGSLQSTLLNTPKPSDGERFTFINLINTPIRQAITDKVVPTSVKKGNVFRTFRDIKDYKPEKLLSNTRRLHSQLIKCQSEPVMDCIELDLSNITNINKFLKRNHMRVNVPNLDKISLLKNLEKYGSDKYLALQESHNLNLYDKLVKRRVAVEVTNKARFEFWKYLFQERISTVLASPELKSLMKHVCEMNLDEHLEFMAGVNQMLHDCSKSALHEVYRIINESAHASYSELKFEVEDLKQLNCRIESVIAKKKDELEKMKQRKKQLEELEKYAEEKRRQLNEINRKIDEANQRRAELSQLNEKLAEQKKALELQLNGGNKAKKVAEKVRYSTVALNRSVGCSELLDVPITIRVPSSSVANKFSRLGGSDMEQIINLCSPCRITCISFHDHVYEVSTLFGLVNFILTCEVFNDMMTTAGDASGKNGNQTARTIDPVNLKVISVQATSPDDAECPVECRPVKCVARMCIEFLSTDGFSELRSRCVGLPMSTTIEQIETIIIPYMVLASDLRCLWLAKYDVEFTMTSLTEQLFTGSLPTKDLRRLLRQPPRPTVTGDKAVLLRKTLGQQSEKQCQSTTGDSSILKPKSKLTFKHLTPPNLFIVSVGISTRTYRILVRFTLFSLKYANPRSRCSVEFEIRRGNLNREEISRYFDGCQPKCGNLYKTICGLQSFISSSVPINSS